MSVTRLVEVKCDGPDPDNICSESQAWSDVGTASDLRDRMADDGWATALPSGQDRCPRCRSDPRSQ